MFIEQSPKKAMLEEDTEVRWSCVS
jgi:hypothetical protein